MTIGGMTTFCAWWRSQSPHDEPRPLDGCVDAYFDVDTVSACLSSAYPSLHVTLQYQRLQAVFKHVIGNDVSE